MIDRPTGERTVSISGVVVDREGSPVPRCLVMPHGYFADVGEMALFTALDGTFTWTQLFHPGLFVVRASQHNDGLLWGQTELMHLDGPTHVTITVHPVTEEQMKSLRR